MRSLKGIAPYKRTSLRWLFPAALILRHSGDHTWAAPTSSSHLTGHNDGRVSLCARISATLSPTLSTEALDNERRYRDTRWP
jgi:hypothetical protein